MQNEWQENIEGVPMFRVVSKLKKLKQGLKGLHKNKYSNVESEAFVALTKLMEIQQSIYVDPHNTYLRL